VNFFQPSFKLKSKRRDGARIVKTYHPPMTPCERVLQSAAVIEAVKARLREQQQQLDPIALLQRIRAVQEKLAEVAGHGTSSGQQSSTPDLNAYLAGLASAWQEGEVRPTYRRKREVPRAWRTRADPFEQTWPMVEQWLRVNPSATAKDLLARLKAMFPELYLGTAQLRTLQRRVQAWRRDRAMQLVFGVIPAATSPVPSTAMSPTIAVKTAVGG
jgi:hypothetical protein